MYRLTGIRLHNVCQHSDLYVGVSAGLTAVVGRNGSGKSSLLRGLAYALTGLVDGMWGTQQDLQKDSMPDVGYAEASFTDGVTNYTVRRYTTSNVKFPDVVYLTDRGPAGVVAQRRRKVDEFMADVFGMPCQLMFQVCWGRQGELAMLLKATPNTIGAFLSQVFDTKALDRIRDRIKTQLDTVASLPSSCVAALERDRQALAALDPESVRHKAAEDARAKAEDLRARCDAMSARMAAGIEPDYKREMRKRLDEASVQLDRFLQERPDPFVDTERDAQTVRTDLDAAMDELRRASSARDSGSWSLRAEQDRLADARRRLDAFDEETGAALERIRMPASGTCPFCGGRIGSEKLYLDSVARTVTGHDGLEAYRAEAAGMRDEHVRRVSAMEAAVESLLATVDRLARDADAADARVSVLTDEYRTAVYKANARQRAAVRDEIRRLDDAVVLDEGMLAEYEDLKRRASEAAAEATTMAALEADNKACRRMLQTAVSDDEAAVRQYTINKEAREALAEIRDAMSQQRAQARYMRSRIRMLNVELARYLSLTGMPFSVKLDEDRRCFVFVTGDGYTHTAAHLSGAQQAMSAVALQMALFSVMRPSMNLYLIDEPTESLDVGNKAVMAAMFERMNSLLPSVDGTMLIVTRDDPVVESCGNVIEIKEI